MIAIAKKHPNRDDDEQAEQDQINRQHASRWSSFVLGLVFELAVGVIFWAVWSFAGVGSRVFPTWPETWHSPQLGDVLGLVAVLVCIRAVIIPKVFLLCRNRQH